MLMSEAPHVMGNSNNQRSIGCDRSSIAFHAFSATRRVNSSAWEENVAMTERYDAGAFSPMLRVVENDDHVDLDALDVLRTFLLDPLSAETGALIAAHAARRRPRGNLRAVPAPDLPSED